MNQKLIRVGVLALGLQWVSAFEPPADSVLLVEEDFAGEGLPKGWVVQTGAWIVAEGVLKGSEIEADRHAAAARRVVRTGDAVYQFKFRLTEGSKGFHFGFDPLPGALDKKGHLFSVIVTPANWQLLKHVDKAKPTKNPNEVLAKADQAFEAGKWFHLRVITSGDTVKAIIEGIEPLEGQHSTFSVGKPTLVFRALGSGVEIDALRVWGVNE
ncbi:MAG: hypothetical protein ABL994_21905 [Verrucomicrobiales bacterium]